ncbi:MAG: ion transporter [Tissierellales bacterium]|jgi:voltage-gated potassium channel|nr:ion transporter [Tissierellales bacterium]
MKQRIFEIIYLGKENDKESTFFDRMIVTLILLNALAIFLSSFESINSEYDTELRYFEIISISIFSLEYLARVWTSDLRFKNVGKLKAMRLYIFSPMAIIDLAAILPFYLPMLIPLDLRFLRMLRLTRLIRIAKLNRYMTSMNLIGRILKREKELLIVTVSIIILLIFSASTLMYYVENPVQPEAFPNIAASFWWAIITITPIGYAPITPITLTGRIISGTLAVLGIGLVALPTGIISSGFMQEFREKNAAEYCPHCGKKIR